MEQDNGLTGRPALLRPDTGLGLRRSIRLLEHLDPRFVHADVIPFQQAFA